MTKDASIEIPPSMPMGSSEPQDDEARARRWAAAVAFIEHGPQCHYTTINKDGRPQQSLVWVGVENDELVIASLWDHLKVRNVRRDPRVSVSMSSGSRDEMGITEYLVVEGIARVTDGGAPELLNKLAKIYVGPDVEWPPPPWHEDPPAGWITRIAPVRVRGWGPWQEANPAVSSS
jgi:PPOX class probable F420-dependent enzyme